MVPKPEVSHSAMGGVLPSVNWQIVYLGAAFFMIPFACGPVYYIGRWYLRSFKPHEVWLHMPLALIACALNSMSVILQTRYGMIGYHQLEALISFPTGLILLFKFAKTTEYTYFTAVTFTKMVMLYVPVRLFTLQRKYRYTIYATGAVILIHFFGGIITSSIACRPFSFYWDKSIPGGHCRNQLVQFRILAVINCIADAMIISIPLIGLRHLHVGAGTKMSLYTTFCMSILGLAVSLVRASILFRVQAEKDINFSLSHVLTWTVIEPTVYLIIATIPGLRVCKRYVFGDIEGFGMLLEIIWIELFGHNFHDPGMHIAEIPVTENEEANNHNEEDDGRGIPDDCVGYELHDLPLPPQNVILARTDIEWQSASAHSSEDTFEQTTKIVAEPKKP